MGVTMSQLFPHPYFVKLINVLLSSIKMNQRQERNECEKNVICKKQLHRSHGQTDQEIDRKLPVPNRKGHGLWKGW